MIIQKNNGERIDYNPNLLKQSLTKSGASSTEVQLVFEGIESQLYNEITTKKLYTLAFTQLKKIRKSYAARYSLKRALRDLGPDGYNFEIWVTELFKEQGCQAEHSKTLQGKAVTHEIDVVALDQGELHLAECKFRNDMHAKISVTTPMYFLSRFNDLKDFSFEFFNQKLQPAKGWLITNAYFSTDAIDFAKVYNVNLIGWDYPQDSSIKSRVDTGGLYPITCLTTLNKTQKGTLLSHKIILVKQLIKERNRVFDLISVKPAKQKSILQEAKELVHIELEE